MGTRVDFYAGRGEQAEWLGSYPFDGNPQGVFDAKDFTTPWTDENWRAWVENFLAKNGDRSTTPDMGWPRPWETSATTDYAYAHEDGVIYGSSFGRAWFAVNPLAEEWGEPGEQNPIFPDMTAHKAVTYGPRSGLIVLGM